MQISRKIEVPTGHILQATGEKNKPLEFLSIGDYGKEKNIVADHMGLSRKIERVNHGEMLPYSEKWVITISTQYGCSMGCTFCDVPKVGPGINVTLDDLNDQVEEGLKIHPEISKRNTLPQIERLNIHYARMGEPTFNQDVLKSAEHIYFKYTMGNYIKIDKHEWIPKFKVIHPVVSTMMPKNNKWLQYFLYYWVGYIKNNLYKGDAGLQLSINSTDEDERNKMFHNNALPLQEIAGMMLYKIPDPKGRKITLNFAVADYTIDPGLLAHYFDPANFIVKLTPMHKTSTAMENGIETAGDYSTYHPYEGIKKDLEKAGFEVIVFITSDEEDLGRITCGNVILSGLMPGCEYKEIEV